MFYACSMFHIAKTSTGANLQESLHNVYHITWNKSWIGIECFMTDVGDVKVFFSTSSFLLCLFQQLSPVHVLLYLLNQNLLWYSSFVERLNISWNSVLSSYRISAASLLNMCCFCLFFFLGGFLRETTQKPITWRMAVQSQTFTTSRYAWSLLSFSQRWHWRTHHPYFLAVFVFIPTPNNRYECWPFVVPVVTTSGSTSLCSH